MVGLYFRGVFLEGLIIEENFAFQNGLGVGNKINLIKQLKTANPNNPALPRDCQPLIWLIIGGLLANWRFGGLVFGGAYNFTVLLWNASISHSSGKTAKYIVFQCKVPLNRVAKGGGGLLEPWSPKFLLWSREPHDF